MRTLFLSVLVGQKDESAPVRIPIDLVVVRLKTRLSRYLGLAADKRRRR